MPVDTLTERRLGLRSTRAPVSQNPRPRTRSARLPGRVAEVPITDAPERAYRSTNAEQRTPRQIGISEGVGPCQGAWRRHLLVWLVARDRAGEFGRAWSRRRGVPARRVSWLGCSVREHARSAPGSLVGEGGQARLPRHLFAHVRAHGAVRPRPSGTQSHTPAAPAWLGADAVRRVRLWSCPSSHAASWS
jgi:hypothetical protein